MNIHQKRRAARAKAHHPDAPVKKESLLERAAAKAAALVAAKEEAAKPKTSKEV